MGKIDASKLPRHIAVIMDGNGKWAKARHLPKALGHAEGARAVDRITESSRALGIKALTLYALSTENWKRPKEEIDTLMRLLYDYLEKKYEKLEKNNIRLNAIGHIERFPDKVREKLVNVTQKTSKNDGMTLTLALNYGGRQEITDAAKTLALKTRSGDIEPDDITEDLFNRSLYTKGLPEVDLLIRTSGELRVSNFLLWQISYAEFYVTKKLWPDFNRRELEKAILDYQSRDRRYGG